MSKKERFYFSHDLHARTDKDIIKLRMKMGMQGVGLYWCIVEMLHEEGGYLMRTECERIAFELQVDVGCITQLIENFKLFSFDEEKFWSESALKRIDIRKEKSISASKSANIMWERRKRYANGMRSHSEGNANKGNESKVNSKNIDSSSLTNGDENFQNKNNDHGKKEFRNFKAQGEDTFFKRIGGNGSGGTNPA
jgi:hypothetical protein